MAAREAIMAVDKIKIGQEVNRHTVSKLYRGDLAKLAIRRYLSFYLSQRIFAFNVWTFYKQNMANSKDQSQI